VGAGDGAFAHRSAQADPSCLFIGVDANGTALADRSRRALKKPARGGAPNALFVRASVEALPEELDGLAHHITILYPWGSLLRAVALPVADVLAGVRRIMRTSARIDVVFALPLAREAQSLADLARVDEAHVGGALVSSYAQAGFDVRARELARSDLDRYPTTWSKRLALDPQRRFFHLGGERSP
jgi:16S rRNA (adenine(1408)-N(1))-methyltransferase